MFVGALVELPHPRRLADGDVQVDVTRTDSLERGARAERLDVDTDPPTFGERCGHRVEERITCSDVDPEARSVVRAHALANTTSSRFCAYDTKGGSDARRAHAARVSAV